ncbi:MAG: endonuclease domain-containing protein [Methylocystis sp.]
MNRQALLIRRARAMRREMTNAERKLWAALRGHRLEGLQFRRQQPCGPWIADFLCHAARLVVEVDGATHSTPEELARDLRRDAWFAESGFAVLRVSNAEVYGEFDGVVETVRIRAVERIAPPRPSPAKAGEGEVSRIIKSRAHVAAPPAG